MISFEKSPYFVPIVFLLFLIALTMLFSDFVFSDKMLHGSDTVQAGIFFRSFLVDHVWEDGSIPQWNPYIFGGMPYVEAFHGDIFYPLSSIKYFGSIFRMLGWALFWHIFLAGICMYFAARQFRLSKTGALMAAGSYMFASYLISFVAPGHDGKIFVTALFPLTMLFLDKGLRAKTFFSSFFHFSLLGLIIGLIILSPHLQMSYFTLWALALYTVYRLVRLFIDTKSIVKLIQPGMLAVYAVVVGLLLSAIQFYPGYIYTSDFSPRADSKKGWEWATSWSMHEEETFSLLIPEFSGVNSQNPDYTRSTIYWGKNAFKDNSESVGVVTIFLALIGLFFSRRKIAYFMGGLALFALLYAVADTTPVFYLFYYLIPKVKALRAASMIMFLFSFSIALLAGIGFDTIREKSRELKEKTFQRFKLVLFALPGFLLVCALLFSIAGRGMIDMWASMFYSSAKTTMVQQGITKLDVAYMNLPSIQTGAWLAFLFTGIAALLIFAYQHKKIGGTILALLILLPVVDGVRFNKRFVSTENQNELWPESHPLVSTLRNRLDYSRVMNFRVLPEDFLPTYGIDVVIGYHGNQLRWYDKLLGGPGAPNQMNPNFLNAVSAEYILIASQQQIPPGMFGDKPLNEAANFGSVMLYQNPNALPRVYLVDSFKVVDTNQVYQLVLGGVDDLRKMVYLEEQPAGQYQYDSLAPGSASITYFGLDSIEIAVEAPNNKILVMTDNYYDAWHVKVDGADAPVLRANGSFRAVEIPAGTKQVVFTYKSARYQTGKMVTTGTFIFLLLVFAAYGGIHVKNRKQKNAEETDV